jgi:hypothetical protein
MIDKKEEEILKRLYRSNLERELVDVMERLSHVLQRRALLKHLQEYSTYLESVQSFAPQELVQFWRGSTAIFDFLRCNGELQHKGSGFKDEVKDTLRSVFKNIERKYAKC